MVGPSEQLQRAELESADPSEGPDADDSQVGHGRYVQLNRRLHTMNSSGAGVITGLTIAAIWGHWHAVATVAAIQVPVIAFNTWINLVYLPRQGRSAETVRLFVNVATGLLASHVSGWPLPVWLWLPFVALAFDHLDRRVAVSAVVGMCAAQDGLALWDGVRWTYPVSFTCLAVFCSELSRHRYASMRQMLVAADLQRFHLQRAHVEVQRAHDRLEREMKQRLALEVELRQAQKLEAIGRLASGVAHEINTPIQYVSDSIGFLQDATKDLLALLQRLRGVRDSIVAGEPSLEAATASVRAEDVADLPYLLEGVPKAFERSLEGLGRVATIVRSMKEFAHPDSKEMTLADLNHAIESTLTICRNECKYVADIQTDFGELPPVRCHLGDVNQAILNIVVNAAHAIGDRVKGTDRRGLISVRTRVDGEAVLLSISDDGGGIPADIRDRVFDPFFTTKEIGKGTGQGLAIARSVVVDKHRGELRVETEVGRGTAFHIRLPIAGPREPQAEAAA